MKIVDLLKFRNRNRLSGSRRRTLTRAVPGTVESLEKRTLLSATDGIVDGTDDYDRIEISDNSSVDPTGGVLLSSLVRISSFSDANFTIQVGETTEFTTTARALTVNGGAKDDLIQIATDGLLSDVTIDIDGGGDLDRVQVIGPTVSGEATYSPDGSEPGSGTFNVATGPSIEFENVETLVANGLATLNVVTPKGADEIFATKAANGLTQISGETNTSDLTPIQLFNVQSLVVDLGASDVDAQDDRFETIDQGLSNSGLNTVTVKGGRGSDEFFIHPSNTTEINIEGGSPSSDGVDRLVVEFAGVLNYRLPRNVTAGAVTSTSHAVVNFKGIESVESTAVTLLSPTASQIVDMARPTFSWTAGENATSYEIWVANLETGKRVLFESVDATTWEANGDLELGRHRFWVRSIINGQPSAWSRPTDFRVNVVPEAHFEFELIDVVDSNYGLSSAGSELNNWGSRNEKWLLGKDGDWFYITPNGSIFAWDGVEVTEEQPLVMGDLIARVSTTYYDNPLLFDAIVAEDEPLNGFGLIDSTPTLILDADGARKYEVWVSSTTTQTSKTFTVVKDDTLRDLQLFTIDDANKLPIGEYRYSVRAFDGQLNPTEWSDVRTFRIVTPPEIIRPTMASIETKTTFEWSEVFGASRYELAVDLVAEDGTLTRVLQKSDITETSYQVTSSLADGTYRFSVRAFNDGVGTVGRSHWSSTATFMVGEDIKPEITGPTQTVTALRPTITWGALDGVARYEIWITESNGSEPLIQEGRVYTNSYTTKMALPEGKYFAWVRAISTRGELTDWSEPFVFQTNGGVSEITSPIGTISDFLPRITWTAVDDAATYELFIRQVGDIGSGGAVEFTIPDITTNGYTPTAPLNNGTYRVWVRALNADGEKGAWSEGSNFTIADNNGDTDSSTDALLGEGLLMAALNEFPSNEQPVEESQPIPDPPVELPHDDEAIVANSESDDASEADSSAVEAVDSIDMQIDKVVTEWPNTNWWA